MPCRSISCSAARASSRSRSAAASARTELAAAGLREDIRVLLKTSNSALWNGEGFHQDYTHLTEAGARYLVEQGVKVVGIDYLSVEQFKKAGAPAHRALLSQGVVIIEGLNLAEAEPGMYEMYCLPLRIVGGDGAPARVDPEALRTPHVLDDVLVMVLAGGVGERLYPLTKERAKPAVYFGGPYRIIDFTLSNCINSGLRRIFIAAAVQVAVAQPPPPHGLERRRRRARRVHRDPAARRSASASTGTSARPTRSTRTSTRSCAKIRGS